MSLTPKQKSFATLVGAKGHSYSEAYRQSYNTENMGTASVNNEASKLMLNREVAAMVERLQGERERVAAVSHASDRERILNRLRVLLENPEGTPAESISIKAAGLLGQSIGMYQKNVAIEDRRERDPETIRQEIMEKLQLLDATEVKH